MEITVSPDQLWHFPLGTPIDECRSHFAVSSTAAPQETAQADGTYDGMYIEAFGQRWLASVTIRDGRIFRETLLLTAADKLLLKKVYAGVREEFGRGIRQGLLRARGYIWEYNTAQLILTMKEARPLTGIYLILTAKNR